MKHLSVLVLDGAWPNDILLAAWPNSHGYTLYHFWVYQDKFFRVLDTKTYQYTAFLSFEEWVEAHSDVVSILWTEEELVLLKMKLLVVNSSNINILKSFYRRHDRTSFVNLNLLNLEKT